MALLEVKNIKKSFGKTDVLKGISFELERGEILAIIGSSGSGKTTLLRCLNYLEKPDFGSIYVNGEEYFHSAATAKLTPQQIRQKQLHFGMVFQSFNLFPQYTVKDNIILAAKLYKQDLMRSEYKARIADAKKQYKSDVATAKACIADAKKQYKSDVAAAKARYQTALDNAQESYKQGKERLKQDLEELAQRLLARIGLLEKAESYPCQLSGGQQQRVAIARALALTPDILCFDEPTSALDPELTGEVLNVIRGLKSSDSTMIVVTHEMSFAAHVADKIIFMADGVIEEMGTPDEVFNHPKSPALKAFLSKTAYSD